MDLTSLEALDFPRIRRQVEELCLTEEGRLALENEAILIDTEALIALKHAVMPFFDLFVRDIALPHTSFPALASILEQVAPEGSLLDGFQLKSLARYIAFVGDWKRFLASYKDNRLISWAMSLEDFSALSTAIDRVFDLQGEIIEEAVPSIKRLKNESVRTQKEIDETAYAWLRGSEHRLLWSDNNPVQKDHRTVLPLKNNFKGRLQGLVHCSSASGATLYIEPYNLIEKNNRLIEIAQALKTERQKLLRDFTETVRAHREGLINLCKTMTQLDLLVARARWGCAVQGAFPQISQPHQSWRLIQARHPLCGNQVIPISLEMAHDIKIVLISGPNAGGKTVYLKTVGLFSLLHQFGLPIPACEQSTLPVWDEVFTEIGDGQSLDRGLSTFSSQMRRMSVILQSATNRSLVLLDEMASGTDPLEGGALGICFLEHFLDASVTVLGTTHHGALKHYSYVQPGIQNVSVEFDPINNCPTYRLVCDTPGSSYALEAAQKAGIPSELISRSRTLLEEGQTDVTRMIGALKEKEHQLHMREKNLEAKEHQFHQEKRQTDLLSLRLKQYESELKQQGLSEMKRFLIESRKKFEMLVKNIREEVLTKEKIKGIRTFLEQVQRRVEDDQPREYLEQPNLLYKEDLTLSSRPFFLPGAEVWIEPEHQKGIIVRSLGNGQAQVAIGSIKITLKTSQLRLVHPQGSPLKSPRVEIHTVDDIHAISPVFTLDLRGLRLNQALAALEKQTDLALLKGISEFCVIHGLGEGILQKGVQKYLSQRLEVKDFFFSHPEEGGFGKTIVRL